MAAPARLRGRRASRVTTGTTGATGATGATGVPGVSGVVGALTAILLTGCGGGETQGTDPDPQQLDTVKIPELGACRVLVPADVTTASNATETVPCREDHTAETYATGRLPRAVAAADYEAPEVSAFAYRTCAEKFETFLGADSSLALRTVVSWAWFRPSEEAWDDGARWYRCDVVGGGPDSAAYQALPTTAQALLEGRPDDEWLVCAAGETVADSPKVSCSQDHQWRAVTTIKVGEPEDDFPGDRAVEVTTRDFCSDSVGAWLNYPLDYEYGYTYFHEAEWDAGNRRSVCWARTDE